MAGEGAGGRKRSGRVPLAERVYLALRDDLAIGALQPTERLRAERLAQRYGVSRPPVREALAPRPAPRRIPLLVGGQAVFWLGWPWGARGVVGAFAATALVCMVWRLFDHGLNT
ncbi:GntR family transcriptional regulator, partial [Nocardia neocaledoniensis]|uniref:GntR family transcriptional regulator n=1 Tax=Nocardia neocaledoniensis TaxID=236511 RepID=UPI002457A701